MASESLGAAIPEGLRPVLAPLDGESLFDAVRYADALRPLLWRSEAVTLIVGHELAIRYIVEARPPRASWSPAKPTQPKGDLP